jgi:hypothetical protein
VNSPLGKLTPVEKQARALELARVAYRTLPAHESLQQVSVTFIVHEQRFLIVNYTNATDVFRFDPGTLAAGTEPAVADPPK